MYNAGVYTRQPVPGCPSLPVSAFLMLVPMACACTPRVDTGLDSDTAQALALCPAYWGIMTTTSARTYESASGSETSTVIRIDGDHIEERTDTQYASDGYSDQMVFWRDFRCDDVGAFVLVEEYAYTITYDDGRVDSGWGEAVYDPPWFAMPAGAEDGSSWTTEILSTDTNDNGQESHFSATFDSTLTAYGDMTVPAGTFPALAWARTSGSSTGTAYVAAGPGLLDDGEFQLTAYTP